jgi:hypothetical protein
MFLRVLPSLSRVPLKLILKSHFEIISQNTRQKHLGGNHDHGALTYYTEQSFAILISGKAACKMETERVE